LTELFEDKLNSFTTVNNSELQQIQLQDLLENRRVLICSVVRQSDLLRHNYLLHLKRKIKYYQTFGIDEVCIVYCLGGVFWLAGLEEHFSKFLALYDTDCGFTQYLADKLSKTQDIEYLASSWSYQVLFNNGKLEHFTEQPTENYIKYLMQYHIQHSKTENSSRVLYMLKTDPQLKNILLEPEHKLLSRQVLTKSEQTTLIGQGVFYYRLWPNVSLDQYLEQ